MIIIGEKINGMFKSVGKAIETGDRGVLQQIALDQLKAGAQILDISPGPGLDNPAEVMQWMVEAVQEVTDAPLAIDTPDPKVMEAGIKAAKNKTVINSCTAETAKMKALFPLAAEHNSDIICVNISEKGIPNDSTAKCELAVLMITNAMEHGISSERLYLDPVILPIGAAQDQASKVFEVLAMFKTLCDPSPKTVVGLSNVSNGTKERPLLNRTYLIMLMAHGLDAAIANPLDVDLMNAVKTSEILLNRKLYCDSYLRA